jgi:HSP20 family protein
MYGRWSIRWHEAGDVAYMPIPVDVAEDGDILVIRASLPGVKPEDVRVDVEGEVVRVRAERKEDELSGEILLRERAGGRLGRTLTLPVRLDAEKTEAALADGVLTIRVTKAETERSRTIPVTGK